MNDDEYQTVQIGVPKFWVNKYENEAHKHWDAFYRRNETNFFKDRHWTIDEKTDGFPCLSQQHQSTVTLVEVGCGVANSVWPLLLANHTLRIFAFDFSANAIRLVRESEAYDDKRVHAFVWDFCQTPLTSVPVDQRPGLYEGTAEYATMIFVLSAVPPDRQITGVMHIVSLLKPGGRILFRDYAVGDMAQARFKSRSRITPNYFVRQDRTLSFFFDEQSLCDVMSAAGLQKIYVRRIHRTIENRKEHLVMQRVFLQAEFRKPHPDETPTPSSK